MNFFKKHETTIYAVIIFVIIIIVGIFLGVNMMLKQEQKSLSNYHEELEDNKEPKQPSRIKRDAQIPKPKIKITQEKYDKITSYALSENENEVLSLNNLSQDEKNKIEEIKNSWKLSLDLLQRQQNEIDEEQQKCDDLITKRNSLEPQIESLKQQLIPLQKKRNDKENEIQNYPKGSQKRNDLRQEKIELVGQIIRTKFSNQRFRI